MTHGRTRLRGALHAALVLATVAWLAGAPGSLADEPGARITLAQGTVEIGTGTPPAWRSARTGDTVRGGEAVRTGRGARAELALGSATVRLYESSLLRVPAGAFEAAGANAVELEQGESLFDVVRGKLRDTFEVRTPEVVVSVKGTRFGVAVEDALAAVSVYRGLVGVRAPTSGMDAEVLVREGFAALGGARHPVELLATPGEDPWSAWRAGEARLPLPDLLRTAPAQRRMEAARDAAREAVARTLRRADGPEEHGEALGHAIRARKEAMGDGKLPVPPAKLEELDDDAAEHLEERVERLLERQGRKGRPPVEEVAVERLVSEALEAPSGGAGGSTGGNAPLPFRLEVLTSGGPNRVQVLDPSGALLHQVTQTDVEAILDEGKFDRLGPLLPVLESNQIDPVTFTEKLDDLL